MSKWKVLRMYDGAWMVFCPDGFAVARCRTRRGALRVAQGLAHAEQCNRNPVNWKLAA